MPEKHMSFLPIWTFTLLVFAHDCDRQIAVGTAVICLRDSSGWAVTDEMAILAAAIDYVDQDWAGPLGVNPEPLSRFGISSSERSRLGIPDWPMPGAPSPSLLSPSPDKRSLVAIPPGVRVPVDTGTSRDQVLARALGREIALSERRARVGRLGLEALSESSLSVCEDRSLARAIVWGERVRTCEELSGAAVVRTSWSWAGSEAGHRKVILSNTGFCDSELWILSLDKDDSGWQIIETLPLIITNC
jgi:hypothetical protein